MEEERTIAAAALADVSMRAVYLRWLRLMYTYLQYIIMIFYHLPPRSICIINIEKYVTVMVFIGNYKNGSSGGRAGRYCSSCEGTVGVMRNERRGKSSEIIKIAYKLYIYIIKVYVYDLPISLDCRYDDNDDEIMILS